MARRAGSIYDLGYQRYHGARLGRRHATWALYTYSLRVVFGIGRSFWAKAAAFGIMAIAFLPAVAQLSFAAIAPEDLEVVEPDDYYGLIEPLLALFCAVIAPELMGRDQRTRTLSLYFSRSVMREDYAIAKYAAMVTALLTITLLPQLTMFIGNMSAASDVFVYLEDNWQDLPAIVASAVLLSAFASGIGLAIGAQTSRRTYSTIAIVAVFVLGSSIAAAVFEAAGTDVGRFALLFSPFHVVRGFSLWMFGTTPAEADFQELVEADLPGLVYATDAALIAGVCLMIIIRRYRGIAV